MSFLRKRESTTRRKPVGNGGLRRAVGIHPDLVSAPAKTRRRSALLYRGIRYVASLLGGFTDLAW